MKIALLPVALGLTAMLMPTATAAQDRPEPVVLHAEVDARPAAVWEALTTPDGVQTFFASEARVQPRIGGAYEMYFLPDNPPGLRGGEGVRILAMEEPGRFLVSWNAPAQFGPLRDQQTVVEFELFRLAGDRTLLTLTHGGWGRGPDWDAVRNYFVSAWPHVLGRLQYRFERDRVDWDHPPDGAAYFRPARAPDLNRPASSPATRQSG